MSDKVGGYAPVTQAQVTKIQDKLFEKKVSTEAAIAAMYIKLAKSSDEQVQKDLDELEKLNKRMYAINMAVTKMQNLVTECGGSTASGATKASTLADKFNSKTDPTVRNLVYDINSDLKELGIDPPLFDVTKPAYTDPMGMKTDAELEKLATTEANRKAAYDAYEPGGEWDQDYKNQQFNMYYSAELSGLKSQRAGAQVAGGISIGSTKPSDVHTAMQKLQAESQSMGNKLQSQTTVTTGHMSDKSGILEGGKSFVDKMSQSEGGIVNKF